MNATIECCRCRHKHNESDRWNKRINRTTWESRCPRCNGKLYYDLKTEATITTNLNNQEKYSDKLKPSVDVTRGDN